MTVPKGLPILFSAPMVRALLREIEKPGKGKTQTRRLLTPNSLRVWTGGLDHGGRYVKPTPDMFMDAMRNARDFRMIEDRVAWVSDPAPHQSGAVMASWLGRLPYRVGELLYVRETCRAHEREDGTDGVLFEADGAFVPIRNYQEAADQWVGLNHYGKGRARKVPAVHMPRWASRITLRLTDIRVERVQDIGEADAIAEGVWHGDTFERFADDLATAWGVDRRWFPGAREWFADLWGRLNGALSWQSNPWVAVYSFRPMLGNIDTIKEGKCSANKSI